MCRAAEPPAGGERPEAPHSFDELIDALGRANLARMRRWASALFDRGLADPGLHCGGGVKPRASLSVEGMEARPAFRPAPLGPTKEHHPMRINQCMTRNVRVVSPDDTIEHAGQIMAQIDAGVLPVAQDDRLVGMITDRDIAIRGVAEGCNPDARVAEVMSQEVLYCYDDQDADDVLENMAEIQVRRMPVMDHDKRLVGIVSIGDLSKREAREAGRALGSIARPGGLHTQ
jgi:CBS domain-containing protein